MVKVIGAGFGRTGTLSTKAALERLTGGRCYHMFEALSHLDHARAWLEAADGDPGGLPDVLAPYRATVDWPACSLWRELRELFPEALVLLTVRPPELWWNSYATTIHALMVRPQRGEAEVGPDLALLDEMGHRLVLRDFPDRYAERTREELIAAYEQHNAEVRTEVPSDRLLEFDVTQGWEPLCEFLGTDVPDEPFPRLNDTAQFRELFRLDADPAPRAEPFTRIELESRFGAAIPGGSDLSA